MAVSNVFFFLYHCIPNCEGVPGAISLSRFLVSKELFYLTNIRFRDRIHDHNCMFVTQRYMDYIGYLMKQF